MLRKLGLPFMSQRDFLFAKRFPAFGPLRGFADVALLLVQVFPSQATDRLDCFAKRWGEPLLVPDAIQINSTPCLFREPRHGVGNTVSAVAFQIQSIKKLLCGPPENRFGYCVTEKIQVNLRFVVLLDTLGEA